MSDTASESNPESRHAPGTGADPDTTPDAGTPTLSIIVVSYNTREMTLEALRSLRAETTTPHEVIVIDNASTDGSAEAIAAEFPDMRLMAETTNHGFALANNIAATHARGEYLLLLNPDTIVLDRAIDRLMTFARATPEAQIWGGRTLFGDRTLNPASCWRRMSLWNVFCRTSGLSGIFPRSEIFNAEAYGAWPRDTERAVDIVVGCFLLIPTALWHRLGGFDPTFVMYGEEADLCLRARAHGASPRVTPTAEIVHYAGASETVRSDKMVRVLRAKATLIRRHFGPATRAPGLWLFRLWPWSRFMAGRILAALRGRRPGEGAAIWREIWDRRAEWQAGYPDLPHTPRD